jgi:hypothetical protein
MTIRRLRIMHNGHVYQNNPHWHLWINNRGNLRGEIIGHKSDFKAIHAFEKQLDQSETMTLFAEAESMRPHFKQRDVVCLPDDVMVELNQNTDGKTKTLFWYVIPLEERQNPVALTFLRMVNQIFEPYA